MNWIKENKFLTGFFAVMVAGLGVLGYLLFGAMGSFDEASTRYTGLATELTRLQNLKLSPSQKNLNALVAQKEDAVKTIAAFQKSLAAKAFPSEPMTPALFQDKLKATKTAVGEKAQGTTHLPDKFFLGFDPYETRPPDSKETATALGHQLKAIEWLIVQLIECKVTDVKPIKRDLLPEESGGGRSGDKNRKPLINSHAVEITVQCQQSALAPFLNALISPKTAQFYILRTISVKNLNDKGPPKTVNLSPPPPVIPPPGGIPGPASPPFFASAPTGAPVPGSPQPVPAAPAVPQAAATYIVGEEQIEVTMLIDIVDFAEPAVAAAR